MRIYSEQSLNLNFANIGSRNWNQKGNAQGKSPGMRSDSVMISPQGKSSGMLTNLLRQKELIQECRESVMKRALEKQEQGISVNIQEQLKEYDAQLDAVEEQIAKELTRQFEEELEKDKENTYQNPRKITEQEAENERMAKVSELTGSLEHVATVEDVKDSVDGQIRVLKSELKLDGPRATDAKRKKVTELESKSDDLANMIAKRTGEITEEQNREAKEIKIVEEEEKQTDIPGRIDDTDRDE